MTSACIVCGRRPMRWWTNDRGDIWCIEHNSMPKCSYCGAPARDAFRGTPRCRACGTGAIDDPSQLPDAFNQVQRALEARGLRVRASVRVVMRSTEKLIEGGAFDSAHTCGVTGYRKDLAGRVVGGLVIAVAAGRPRAHFEHVAAHEWTHAFMADRGRYELPLGLSEGFAEFVAYEYLVNDSQSEEALHRAKAIRHNPDAVYGGGFRGVQMLVDRLGSQTVFKALALGRLDILGYPS